MSRTIVSLAAVAALVLATGCAATSAGKAEDIKQSGYLSSYAGLTATDDSDRAAFVYVKQGLDLSGYTGVLIERPEARMSSEMLREIGPEDTSYLLGAFADALRESIDEKFRLVEFPGPGILRIRSCLTDADSAVGALTPFSRILPVGVVLSSGKRLVTGSGINAAKASAELEVIDSETGEQLAAALDRRLGTGVARNVFTDWGDVKSAFDLWAERTTKRLEEHGMRPTK
jgi:Protein of unknown function (DUF3313)